MRLPTTPVRRSLQHLQTQIDDLGRAHHGTAMAVAQLRGPTGHGQVDVAAALSAALDLVVALQAELDDTRRRLAAQESQAAHTAAALDDLTQRQTVLSRIVEAQLSTSIEVIDGASSGPDAPRPGAPPV